MAIERSADGSVTEGDHYAEISPYNDQAAERLDDLLGLGARIIQIVVTGTLLVYILDKRSI